MSGIRVSSTNGGPDNVTTDKDHGTQGTAPSLQMVEKLKNLDHLFSQRPRRFCALCATKKVSWSCYGCDRHLPNGNWAELGLPAKDEDESLFGMLRQAVRLDLVQDEDDQTFVYDQIQYVLKSWIMFGDASASLDTLVVEGGSQLADPTSWRLVEARLSAEGGPASIFGILKSLAGLGSIDPTIALGWIEYGRSVAKCRVVLESAVDGSIARTPLPAALANEIEIYKKEVAPNSMSPPTSMSQAMLDGICKYTNLSMADFEAQPPAFSGFAKVMIDRAYNIHQGSIESSENTETPRCTVGPPARKYLVEVAKAVEANNKYLDEERVQKEQAKEQAKKNREAKKQEAATKKARAQEDQQKARQRKSERRKQGKLQRAEKQANVRGSWHSPQPSSASPMESSKPHEKDNDTTVSDTIHGLSADEVPLSLEDVVEAIIQENAPAHRMDEHKGKAASSSNLDTLIVHSASDSVAKTCSIDTAEDCRCAVCLNYDTAIDKLQGGPPHESPSHPEAISEILSPEPRSPHSSRVVGRLEDAALALQTDEGCSSKDQASENAFSSQCESTNKSIEGENLPKDTAPEHVVASQHHSISESEEGTQPKSTLNVNAPPFIPNVIPGLPRAQRLINYSSSTNDLPNWTELGLAAEAAHDSLSSRVQQLKVIGALTPEDTQTFGTIISKLWRQIYLATQDNPNMLKPTSSPGVSGSWKWSNYQLSAEDREDSIFGVSKKLALLGFWSSDDEKALYDLTVRVAKTWFLANSEKVTPSTVVAERLFSNTLPERNAKSLQNTSSTASSRSSFGSAAAKPKPTGPLPGLYRNGRMIITEVDMFDHASSDGVIPEESSGEEGMDADSDEVIIFKPRGRR